MKEASPGEGRGWSDNKKGIKMSNRSVTGMRPRKVRRLLAAMAAGAVLAGTGIGWAAEANADNADTFITVLDSQGIIYSSEAAAIEAGYEVCDARQAGLTDMQVIGIVYRNTGLDAYNSGFFVGAAKAAFCPWYLDGVAAA